jgi:hypothetical protein
LIDLEATAGLRKKLDGGVEGVDEVSGEGEERREGRGRPGSSRLGVVLYRKSLVS